MSKTFEALKALDYKDIATRALWTFIQAFLATSLLALEQLVDLLFLGDWDSLYALGVVTAVAGVAAGLSAVKTIIVQTIRSIKA